MARKAEIHRIYLDLQLPQGYVRDCPPASQKLPRSGAKFQGRDASVPRQTRTSSRRATLRGNPYRFVYLDVGVWAGNDMYFGLICKSCVWLCKFKYEQTQAAIPYEAERIAPPLLREIWRRFTDINIEMGGVVGLGHGFEVVTWAEVPMQPPERDIVYLFLPDMHLPGIPHYKEFYHMTNEEKRKISSDAQRALNGEYVSIKRREEISRYSEYCRGKDADIFKDAGKPLDTFLEIFLTLARNKLKGKLKIIHVGDMHELWQGMGEWSTYFDGSPKGLVLEKGALGMLMDRIKKIESQNDLWMSKLKQFDKLNITTYLYGNHDVYYVDALRNKNKEWNLALADRETRQAYFYDENIFAEHGHRMDGYNQDGNWVGPFITELVYYFPFLRWLDPDRREEYHRLSAIELYYQKRFLKKPGFSIFVMGHTHKPDLVVIEIYRKPGEIQGSFCLDCHKGTELYRRYNR